MTILLIQILQCRVLVLCVNICSRSQRSHGQVTCHEKLRCKPILILSIDTSSSDTSIDILVSVSPITTGETGRGRVVLVREWSWIWQRLLLHTKLSFEWREQTTSSFHLRWKCYLRVTRKTAHFVMAVSHWRIWKFRKGVQPLVRKAQPKIWGCHAHFRSRKRPNWISRSNSRQKSGDQ